MKKYMLIAALASIVALPAMANMNKKMGHLTEAQKACVAKHHCPETNEAMGRPSDCKKRAFEACGIEKPVRKKGDKSHKDEYVDMY